MGHLKFRFEGGRDVVVFEKSMSNAGVSWSCRNLAIDCSGS